jgi:transcriptional regulator with XRE-family HTH domain
MIIGDRLPALREQKNFSQGEIEKRTGLLRCYISRVENGHTVPAVETLEKFARALEVSLVRSRNRHQIDTKVEEIVVQRSTITNQKMLRLIEILGTRVVPVVHRGLAAILASI